MSAAVPEDALIQGKRPGSAEEWRFALGLNRAKVAYYYQYAIDGGNRVRGGILVDFVVFNPFKTPVEIESKHWHTGALGADDHLKRAREAQYFGRPVIAVWGEEIPDDDAVDRVIREKIL